MTEAAADMVKQPSPGQLSDTSGRWWQIADFGVFGVWMALVMFILHYHEPWADESQAWLIARDLDLKTLWFHEMRYEGTPGLWHTLLWVAQHWFGAPYASMGVIGFLCAALGVGLILWKAPFPRPLRYLLIFSYVLVYQYAVIARSYNLLPVALFAVASCFHDREHPGRMTLALILLANVSLHGTLLAVVLGACYLFPVIRNWSALGRTLQRNYMVCIGVISIVYLLLFFVLKPTPDMLMFAPEKIPANAKHPVSFQRIEELLGYAFFDQPMVSALFLILAGSWCFLRRNLLPYLLSVSLMIFMYLRISGRPHHHGTVFLAAITGIWIAWPKQGEPKSLSRAARIATNSMVVLLAALFCLNIWDAGVAMRNDYRYPYSGSEDAAKFLKQVGADRATIYGYTYGMSAIQAYFDHDILANTPTTYIHYGKPFYAFEVDFNEIQSRAPLYVIIFSAIPDKDFRTVSGPLAKLGYRLVHFSDGHLFYKRSDFGAAAYFIFARDNI